jgi:uncharacterized membrane protein SpoIIM required for sporulation
MKQHAFETRYRPQWQAFAATLNRLEQDRKALPDDDFASQYRRICQAQALCEARQYSSHLSDELGELVLRGHRLLYKRKTQYYEQFLQFVVGGFPRALRREARLFLWVSLCFYLPAIGIALAMQYRPELIYSLMSPTQVQNFEGMYNPSQRTLGEARDSATNWLMFGHYIQNNIGIAFKACASGLVFGVGAVFLVTFNGLMIGAVAAHLVAIGYSHTFFTIVIAHGSFELTAIVISGCAGLRLGLALIHPGPYTRHRALREASSSAIQLVMGAALMLLIAAFVEAFWSSNNLLPAWMKYSLGSFCWVLVGLYLAFAGRRNGSA